MKLVFDTNIIHEDFHLYGPRITKLCSAAEKLGYNLMIPDVVVDEMVNHYRQELLKNFSGYARIEKLVARTRGGEDIFDKDKFISDKVHEYEIFLKQRLGNLGIKTIAYPKIDIKELVSKELKVKKPFKEIKESVIGYRDALIWECVKSICQPQQTLIEDPQIEFLTENFKDFAGAEKTLHPDLVEELINAGCASNCVTLITDVNKYFETKIDTELEELEQIKEALINTGKFNRFDVMEEIKGALTLDYVKDLLNNSDFDSERSYYLPGYVEDPSINYVDSPFVDNISVRRLTDQNVLIEIQASVLVDMDFLVYKPDYYTYAEDKKLLILEEDWNDYYMLCEGTAKLSANLTFRTTPKLGKVLSANVQIKETVIEGL